MTSNFNELYFTCWDHYVALYKSAFCIGNSFTYYLKSKIHSFGKLTRKNISLKIKTLSMLFVSGEAKPGFIFIV